MLERKEIRQALIFYFQEEDFSIGAFTIEDKGSIESLIEHTIKVFSLPSKYHLKSSEKTTGKNSTKERQRLRSLVGQEVAQMKREGLVRRVTWGRYRPLE